MRLLHTITYTAYDFIGEDIPEYAILSHTWEDDEVLFRHLEDGSATTRKGWDKVKRCCAQAQQDGWTYVWIDTCCIDKSSSAELSEAINSMYKWYHNSAVCYAYLNDVLNDDLDECRWFNRGWTLQELLAPTQLFFYNKSWQDIGTKFSTAAVIQRITGIDPIDLMYPKRASAARKMFWASYRQTTRAEDMAYCLLGLFDVNMPLLYGEGPMRAFTRLQYEILTKTNDDSIFAWRQIANPLNQKIASATVLAPDPTVFAYSGRIVKGSALSNEFPVRSFVATNVGFKMDVMMRQTPEQPSEYQVLLDCSDSETGDIFVIVLSRKKENTYRRIGSAVLGSKKNLKLQSSRFNNDRHESYFKLHNVYIELPLYPSAIRYPDWIQCEVDIKSPEPLGPPSERQLLFEKFSHNSWGLSDEYSNITGCIIDDSEWLILKWRSKAENPCCQAESARSAFAVIVGTWSSFFDVKIVLLQASKPIMEIFLENSWGFRKPDRLSKDRDVLKLPTGQRVIASLRRSAAGIFRKIVLDVRLDAQSVAPIQMRSRGGRFLPGGRDFTDGEYLAEIARSGRQKRTYDSEDLSQSGRHKVPRTELYAG